MKLIIAKYIIIFLVLTCGPSSSFAWATYTYDSDGFRVDAPCTLQRKHTPAGNNYSIKNYSCFEWLDDGNWIQYQIASAERDGGEIIYKKAEITSALKTYIIGNLGGQGVRKENIQFHRMQKYKNKYNAVRYYSDSIKDGINPEGVTADGISALVRGKHFKIGVTYLPRIEKVAQERLKIFLYNFKHE